MTQNDFDEILSRIGAGELASCELMDTLYVELAVPPELESQFAFQQGQYLTFSAEIGEETVRRSYSICSGLGGPLAVAIKKIDGGAFSTYAHEQFAPGTPVQVLAPDGQFFTALEPERARAYLCIAVGSGITPVISNIRTILEHEPLSTVTLLYGNRRSQDVIFREELCWLKNAHLGRLQWINIFTRETQSADILNGPTSGAYTGQSALPPFQWSRGFDGSPHAGLPDRYDFGFITTEPLDFAARERDQHQPELHQELVV